MKTFGSEDVKWFLAMVSVALVALTVSACGGGASSVGDEVVSVDVEDLMNPAGNPEELYANMGTFNPPLEGSDPRLVGSQNFTVDEFVQYVGSDANAKWKGLFESAGYSYSNAAVVTFEEPVSITGCGGVADPEFGPFYCTENQTIYYPLTWVDSSTGMTPAESGDFAVAVIMAHEMGHHIQNLDGSFADLSKVDAQFELQADCYAGLWSRSVYDEGLLEPGDIGEAVEITANAGDLPGTPIESAGAHGSDSQRVDAFFTGYDSGDIRNCQYQ